jgi:predicted  nucleic acid-binding Zn-ribbon protein
MHEWVEKVLIVQDKDGRIRKLQDQIQSVPVEKKKAQASLADADAALAAAKESVITAEKAIKNLEIEVESLEDKRRDFATKSMMIKDNDEYRAALHQMETCRNKVRELEDQELIFMEQLENAREQLKMERREHDAAKQRVEQLVADLDTRLQNCTAQMEKLRAERETCIAEVPADIASRYERILASRNNSGHEPVVLAPISGYNCGYCHMNIPPQIRMDASKGQLVSCPNCSVLLYFEP